VPLDDREAVREAMTATGIVHIDAHAHFDAANPLGSRPVLADVLLGAREILGLEAPALSLLTLRACETGISETDAAEQLIGLMRAPPFAGADAMVANLV
jgi:CHAT domain-containing protein